MEINQTGSTSASSITPDVTETTPVPATAVKTTTTTTVKPTPLMNEAPLDLAPDESGGGFIDHLVSLFTKPSPVQSLTPDIDNNGVLYVKTDDGYTVQFDGKQMDWSITGPDGKKTYVWGDPHVEESDGTKWNFKKQSTFEFGNNKITVLTSPLNNSTVTKTVTLYNGDDRLTVTDIDLNRPRITGWKFDATEHDARLDDGVLYQFISHTKKNFEWKKL